MRLLFLTHRFPYPPNKGDKIRSFHILSHLAKQHDVYLACLVDDKNDLSYIPEIGKHVRQIAFETIRPWIKKLSALYSIFRSRPITVGYFYSTALQRQIDSIIDEADIDAFVCFSSPMAEYLFRSRHANGKISSAMRVMDLIDIDSYKWKQYADQSRSWKSWLYNYEAKHLARYERRIAGGFDHVLVVSEQEKKLFPGGSETSNLAAMSNGVDLDFFRPEFSCMNVSTRPAIVFTGAMDYRPNIDGIKWFVDSVFRKVQAVVPDVELFIVGSKPAAEIERLGRLRGVVVTGFVNDVREYIVKASVCIAPLRVARGIQNKVLEAMAMGKAVVCTPQAYEGICATPDRDLVVAESAEAFADAVIHIMEHQVEAIRLGRSARLFVEKNYTWAENLRLLDRILSKNDVQLCP